MVVGETLKFRSAAVMLMKTTHLVVTIGVIALGIYDLAVVTFGGVESSVSRMMQEAGFENPTIIFTVGYICGHIFGYMPPRKKKENT